MPKKTKTTKGQLTHKGWSRLLTDERFIIGIILVYSFLVWWPTRNLPYYWDAAMFINPATRELTARHLLPLVPAFQDFAHPPLFWLFHSAILTWLGNSLIWIHVAMVPFLPLYVWLSYKLAKHWLNTSTRALGVAALVGVTPFVVAEYGQFYMDLPEAVLILGAIYALVRKRPGISVGVFLLAVLTKLTAWIIAPMLLMILWQQDRRGFRKHAVNYLVLPVFVTVGWLIYHNKVTGWWLINPERMSYTALSLERLGYSVKQVFYGLLIDQGRWLLTGVTGLWIWLKRKRLSWEPTILVLLVGMLSYVGFYSFVGELNYRYLLPVYPLVMILMASFWQQSSLPLKTMGVVAVVAGVGFVFSWHPQTRLNQYIERPFEDLRYQDIIRLGQLTSAFVTNNYPQALVYGSYPESYELADVTAGYTKQAIAFNYCQYFQNTTDERPILVFRHYFSPLQPGCETLLSYRPHTLVKHLAVNGLVVDIYGLDTKRGN